MNIIDKKLNEIKKIFDDGLTTKNTLKIFEIIGLPNYSEELLDSFVLWNDCLPLADEIPYTKEQRNYHILWECIDRVPLGINVAFAIPFRAMIGKKLFKHCGKNFLANEGCRFNFGQNIYVGDDVTWNHCCYIDSKGGVTFKDHSMITEYTKIFSHAHSESDHMQRTYKPVVLDEYAKVYTATTILPGVTIGKGAIVGTGSIVTHSVEPGQLVLGIPAKYARDRKMEGKELNELNHYTLKNKMFQDE